MELSFLNKGLRIRLKDERDKKEKYSTQRRVERVCGIHRLIENLSAQKRSFLRAPARMWKWTWLSSIMISYQENIFTFVNNIPTTEGGTHLIGFKTALTRSLNTYAQKNNLIKNGGMCFQVMMCGKA